MESNYYYHEESSDDQEMVSDQENNNDLGVGRSYECVFCKRGFNTAQALGGHMNIHRKDRARNKPNSTKLLQESPPPPPPPPLRLTPENNVHIARDHHHPPLAYATYFPAASSSNCSLHHDRGRQRLQPLIPGDWRMRVMSLEVEEKDIINQDKELDLELRLGYDS